MNPAGVDGETPKMSKSFAEVLSDRWGEPLDVNAVPSFSPDDAEAVARLGVIAGDCDDVGFVARTRDSDEYGVVLEWEIPWSQSDDEYAALMMWGDKTDNYIVDAVVDWANLISNAAHARSIPHRVCVLVDSDDIFGGNLGVHLFIPEDTAEGAPEFARLCDDMYGALTET